MDAVKKDKIRQSVRVNYGKIAQAAVPDVVATAELPDEVKNDLALHAGCIAGASHIDEVGAMLRKSGFSDIRIEPKDESREFIRTWAPGRNVEDYVGSATIEARKP